MECYSNPPELERDSHAQANSGSDTTIPQIQGPTQLHQ